MEIFFPVMILGVSLLAKVSRLVFPTLTRKYNEASVSLVLQPWKHLGI